MFSLTGNGDSLVSDGRCTQDTNPARNVTHVIFLAWCSLLVVVGACRQSSHAQHASRASRFKSQWVLCSQNICLHTLAQHGTLYTFSPSLMIPPLLSTSSLLTCTPIRPSTRPSTEPLQISSSDEILPLRRFHKCVFRFLGRSALAHFGFLSFIQFRSCSNQPFQLFDDLQSRLPLILVGLTTIPPFCPIGSSLPV